MPKTPFETIWNRIVTNAGKEFSTKTGLPFIYRIDRNGFYSSRTQYRYRIAKADFESAYAQVPLNGPGVINKTVRGPAFVWAVLHDTRISLGEW